MIHDLINLGLIILTILHIAMITFSVSCRLYFQLIHEQDEKWDNFRKWMDLPLLIFHNKRLGNDSDTSIVLENISRSPAFSFKIVQLATYGYWERAEFY
jgi:hypothetical protein